MSVLMELAMFPTDKGDSVSQYVSKIIQMIDKSGFEYQLTAMGTLIETPDLDSALQIINQAYKELEPVSSRVYSTIKLDIQKNKNNRITGKVKSVEDKIGSVKK